MPSTSSASIYILGDQTNAHANTLTSLLHTRSSPLLTAFLEQTHYTLRVEIASLPTAKRQLFPRFSSISDLLARSNDEGPNPALESALLCLTQLGSFIRYVSFKDRSEEANRHRYHEQGAHAYPSAENAAVLGLCNGSLAAAAISCSSTVVDLIPAAIEVVLIAFRAGLRVIGLRDDLEQKVGKMSPNWSVLVGMQESQAAEELKIFSAVTVSDLADMLKTN